MNAPARLSALPPTDQSGRRLARALLCLMAGKGWIGRMTTEPWASATFSGARHMATLHLPDPASARQLADALPEADLPMPGQFAADLVARPDAADPAVLNVEILTIEER